MSYEPTLIAPYNSGLSQYYKPFLIGNDAFVTLDNCYSSRGVIRKREGSTVLGRLTKWVTATAITSASPPQVTAAAHGLSTGDMVYLENVINSSVNTITPGLITLITTSVAHGFVTGNTVLITGITGSIGAALNNIILHVTVTGASSFTVAVDTAGLTYIAGGTIYVGALNDQAFAITSTGVNTFTLQNLNTGQNVPASGSATSADIYLPILGTRTFIQTSTGNEFLIAFHPKKAFLFNASIQAFVNISFNTAAAPISWTGTKDNFFYTNNYATVMWTTNNVDLIRFFNGSLTAGWADHNPQLNSSGTLLNKALIILPYKGRLIVLNTTEGTTNFAQRARWCQLGTPFVANAPSGFSNDTTSWRDDIPGKGGYIDADTNERIISADIIQDTLIVGFQFSSWRLRYTGNEILPFIWERIDTQYGSEGTYTNVPFDDSTLQISRRGIVAASFNNVQRIDLQVPDIVNSFEAGNTGEGINRIQGARDYQKRLVYWIYGDQAQNSQTPNRVLCFNYQDNTWSTFTQSFTTLGSYKLTVDNTWATWTSIWDGDTSTWDTPLDQQNTPMIVAGDVTSSVWHIMNPDVSTDNGENYNFTITTNIINPYFKFGKRCRLAYYDLYTTSTSNGQVTIKNYTDDDPSNPWLTRTVTLSDNVKNVKYTRVFLGMIARNHQITITLSDDQLTDSDIGGSDFELQGIIFHTRVEGRIKR